MMNVSLWSHSFFESMTLEIVLDSLPFRRTGSWMKRVEDVLHSYVRPCESTIDSFHWLSITEECLLLAPLLYKIDYAGHHRLTFSISSRLLLNSIFRQGPFVRWMEIEFKNRFLLLTRAEGWTVFQSTFLCCMDDSRDAKRIVWFRSSSQWWIASGCQVNIFRARHFRILVDLFQMIQTNQEYALLIRFPF